MAVDPGTLDTPERGRALTTRGAKGKPLSLADRIARARDAAQLPGARKHCFDCFSRGVAAAIAAIEREDDDAGT